MNDSTFREFDELEDLLDGLRDTSHTTRNAPQQRDTRQHYSTRYNRRRHSCSGIHRRGKKQAV